MFHTQTTMKYVQESKRKEALFGLTVGVDFVSSYDKNK